MCRALAAAQEAKLEAEKKEQELAVLSKVRPFCFPLFFICLFLKFIQRFVLFHQDRFAYIDILIVSLFRLLRRPSSALKLQRRKPSVRRSSVQSPARSVRSRLRSRSSRLAQRWSAKRLKQKAPLGPASLVLHCCHISMLAFDLDVVFVSCV